MKSRVFRRSPNALLSHVHASRPRRERHVEAVDRPADRLHRGDDRLPGRYRYEEIMQGDSTPALDLYYEEKEESYHASAESADPRAARCHKYGSHI